MTNGKLAADTARTAFLWNVHQYINNYIRFADTKAALTIGWATLVVGGLLKASFYDPHLSWEMFVRYMGLVMLVGSVGCSIWSINPRLNTSQPKGYIFWSSILAHGTRECFVAAVADLSPEEAQAHVAQHLYDLSSVCRRKFYWANLGIRLVTAGTGLAGFSYLFRSVTS